MSTALPRWDMTTIFPSLESKEFSEAFTHIITDIGNLASLFDRHNVRRNESSSLDDGWVAAYEEVTGQLNNLLNRIRTLGSYIGCFTSTDARDELAQSKESLLNTHSIKLNQLQTRYVAWVGTADVDELLRRSEVARNHEYPIRRAQTQAQHQMSEAEESLMAELQPSGLTGWARLHGNMTALMTATVNVEGEEKLLPMSSVRALANDGNREVRKAAYEAEIKAWEAVEVPMAAALNGIKGFQRTVRNRRNYRDDVEPTLLANSVDRPILEAMQQACVESFPDFRRYLKAKSRAIGVDRLGWYDINAALGESKQQWTWPDAKKFIVENFGRYSSRLAEFAERSFRERWTDAEPRVGKEGGAYCTGIRPGESRVMMNFDGSFMGVSTLAHELGHAYHNLNLKDRTPLQRGTPSTLAETASIFCETLTFDAALKQADKAERLVLLDTTLQRDLQVVVDIHSRFLFEKGVFEKRAERDLTVAEFKALMVDAQRQTYGEDMEPLHPYMWAVKGHYYGPTFYNYPYTFGLLFGLGLYSHYQRGPETFRKQYDEFLSCTGLANARTLGEQFGVDVSRVDFWRGSLDIIRGEIADFEALVS